MNRTVSYWFNFFKPQTEPYGKKQTEPYGLVGFTVQSAFLLTLTIQLVCIKLFNRENSCIRAGKNETSVRVVQCKMWQQATIDHFINSIQNFLILNLIFHAFRQFF